ncbi:hypothetical protein F7R21_25085 [Burkholderia latens]|uniref:Uncharacterized protein n=1 Tax=Burkholderia latens TaxID=488446 RepID=A0A6H9SLD9_9BURK|nr:hypothetical protein F7R21_25085 [Burkholderia latens]
MAGARCERHLRLVAIERKLPASSAIHLNISPFCRDFCKSGRKICPAAIVSPTGCARRAAPFCKRPRSSPLAQSSIFFTLRGLYD